jgi:hypothetical protein
MMCNTETTPKEGEIDSEKIFFSSASRDGGIEADPAALALIARAARPPSERGTAEGW